MEAASVEPNDKCSLVQQLAKDLSGGDLELVSFPDIALRTRKALNDDMCTTEQIVQILGAKPVLAAKILAISNSASRRPKPVLINYGTNARTSQHCVYVPAKKYTQLNPDEALFVGLMHDAGKLYILGRAEEHPALFSDEEELLSIMND